MKKALIIIAVVAGYSLIETGLLLSVVFPHPNYSSYEENRYLGIWGGCQFLLIPGLAILLSRIIYGSHQLGRRALVIFVAGFLIIPAIFVLFAPFSFGVFCISQTDWASWIKDVLATVLILMAASGIALVMFSILRRAGKWGVQLEAKRWLAERQLGTDPREIKWRNRGIRIASCIPVVIVLLVFLFLPETWGILSHLSQPHSGNLRGYRIQIPATWVILFRYDDQDGRSSVNGIAGRGIDLDIKSFIPTHAYLSRWNIGTGQYNQSPKPDPDSSILKGAEVFDRRIFMIGSDSITCLEYWPAESHYTVHYLPPRPKHFEDSSYTFIECYGSGRFYAYFEGERRNVPAFYKMISGISPAK